MRERPVTEWLVVVEADDGSWLAEPNAYESKQVALDIAKRRATQFGRAASVYRCEHVCDIAPLEHESLSSWAESEAKR